MENTTKHTKIAQTDTGDIGKIPLAPNKKTEKTETPAATVPAVIEDKGTGIMPYVNATKQIVSDNPAEFGGAVVIAAILAGLAVRRIFGI